MPRFSLAPPNSSASGLLSPASTPRFTASGGTSLSGSPSPTPRFTAVGGGSGGVLGGAGGSTDVLGLVQKGIGGIRSGIGVSNLLGGPNALGTLGGGLGLIGGLIGLARPGGSAPSKVSSGLGVVGGAAQLGSQFAPSLASSLGPLAAGAGVVGGVTALGPLIHAFAGGNRELKAAQREKETFEKRSQVLEHGFRGFPGSNAAPEALAAWLQQTLPRPVLIEVGGGKGVPEEAWASSNEAAKRLAQQVTAAYEQLQRTRPDLIRSMQLPSQSNMPGASDILVDWVMAAQGRRAGEGVRIPIADISEFGSGQTQLAGSLIPGLPDLATAPSINTLLAAASARLREQNAANQLPPSLFDPGVLGAGLAPSSVLEGMRQIQGLQFPEIPTEARPALPPELEGWLAAQLAAGFGDTDPMGNYRAALQNFAGGNAGF